MACDYKRMNQCIHVNKKLNFTYKMPTYFMLRLQTSTKNFYRTHNDKCSIWGLKAAAIPRRVKVQNIKGIASVLADSVSRPKAVGIYHDIDSNELPTGVQYTF